MDAVASAQLRAMPGGVEELWQALLGYTTLPHAWIAVLGPMVVSLVLLAKERRAARDYAIVRLVWWLSLPVMYATARWRIEGGVAMLHILALFSMVCLYLVWRRIPVSPGLAYGLTFFSLFWVDLARAFEYALTSGTSLATFYYGVGGAGFHDGLFVFPLLTAAAVRYGHWRQAHPDAWRALLPNSR
jgi:hypothetical protein